jgi:hypothetical protein
MSSKWSRVGAAAAFGLPPVAGASGVGWVWEIKRDGVESRQVRVEVARGPFRPTDLPAEARNAIRSRGATAVDNFLNQEDPPACIFVSTLGIRSQAENPKRPSKS